LLEEEIKRRARQAGADLAGIAPARLLPEASFLKDWLREGRHGSMGFMLRDVARREDIRLWHPQSKSVLVCAFRYGGSPSQSAARTSGLIARYAAHEDYHRALKGRLESVLAWLRERCPGADGRVFADSSPVMERLYAYHAGLGWIGRNCLLVNEELGSFFLIAGISLDLELAADHPVQERCGACRLCLEACPSRALVQDRVLDARLCSAYLTLELRGPLPQERRAGIGRWVAGCDLCQEACPFNGGPPRSRTLAPVLPAEIPLEEAALCGEQGFRERFGRTPLSRLKARGLKRNALLAMGNSGLPRFRAALERSSGDPDPMLSEQARWSLARLPR